jgi:hypothetical protein
MPNYKCVCGEPVPLTDDLIYLCSYCGRSFHQSNRERDYRRWITAMSMANGILAGAYQDIGSIGALTGECVRMADSLLARLEDRDA